MRNETHEVGTILKGTQGHVLVTTDRTLRSLITNIDLEAFQDQRVLVAGQRTQGGAIAVSEIYPLLSEQELRECTSFVLARHGPGARKHASARLSSARIRHHAGDIEIWTSILDKIDQIIAREPWPRSEQP